MYECGSIYMYEGESICINLFCVIDSHKNKIKLFSSHRVGFKTVNWGRVDCSISDVPERRQGYKERCDKLASLCLRLN